MVDSEDASSKALPWQRPATGTDKGTHPTGLFSVLFCMEMFYLVANLGHKEVIEHLLKMFFLKVCCNPTTCVSNKGLARKLLKVIARMPNSLLNWPSVTCRVGNTRPCWGSRNPCSTDFRPQLTVPSALSDRYVLVTTDMIRACQYDNHKGMGVAPCEEVVRGLPESLPQSLFKVFRRSQGLQCHEAAFISSVWRGDKAQLFSKHDLWTRTS